MALGVAAAQGAPSISVRVGGVDSTTPPPPPPAASGPGPLVDARLALAHVFRHVLGAPAPAGADARAEAVPVLPSSDVLQRPSHALLATVEDGGDALLGGGGGAAWVVALTPNAGAAGAEAAAHVLRDGVSPASLEILPAGVTGMGAAGSGVALRWASGAGFARVAGASNAAFAWAGLEGVTACGEGGVAALRALGASHAAGASRPCGVFTTPAGVVLDTAAPGVAQALSEAAAVAALGAAPASGATTARTLHRVHLSGIAQAAQAGAMPAQLDALRELTGSALRAAEVALASAASAGGSVSAVAVVSAAHAAAVAASVVDVEGPGGLGGAAVSAGFRRLQVDPNDPCIDFGNCTTPSAAPNPASLGPPLKAIEIYHIALWTSVLLGLLLIGVIYAMLGMDDVKDPQLYAQVADSRSAAAAGAAGGR